MPTRAAKPPLTDPAHVPDVFASGFDVQDWEDWLRLVCWADMIEPADDGSRAERRKAAAIVIPRSSLYELIKALRHSAAHYTAERHS